MLLPSHSRLKINKKCAIKMYKYMYELLHYYLKSYKDIPTFFRNLIKKHLFFCLPKLHFSLNFSPLHTICKYKSRSFLIRFVGKNPKNLISPKKKDTQTKYTQTYHVKIV